MIDDKWKLKEACDICIADIGKEDEELSKKLYERVSTMYGTVPGKDWDYALVDDVLHDMLEAEYW